MDDIRFTEANFKEKFINDMKRHTFPRHMFELSVVRAQRLSNT
jgi:hypothetical protein